MEGKERYDSWSSMRNEDLQEEDVWDVLDGSYEHDQPASEINETSKPSFSSQRFHQSSPRSIPITTTRSGGIRQQFSAPVNVPDWPITHRTKPKKGTDEDGGGCDERVSPAEYFIERGSRPPSSSVVEGAGRTLKGRDLSKVRNAVLKQTGFLEDND